MLVLLETGLARKSVWSGLSMERRGAQGWSESNLAKKEKKSSHLSYIRRAPSSLSHSILGALHTCSVCLLSATANMSRQKFILDKLARTFQIRNKLLRQSLAECLGTLILVVSPCDPRSQLVVKLLETTLFIELYFYVQNLLVFLFLW